MDWLRNLGAMLSRATPAEERWADAIATIRDHPNGSCKICGDECAPDHNECVPCGGGGW